jgi:hypothetical protein
MAAGPAQKLVALSSDDRFAGVGLPVALRFRPSSPARRDLDEQEIHFRHVVGGQNNGPCVSWRLSEGSGSI